MITFNKRKILVNFEVNNLRSKSQLLQYIFTFIRRTIMNDFEVTFFILAYLFKNASCLQCLVFKTCHSRFFAEFVLYIQLLCSVCVPICFFSFLNFFVIVLYNFYKLFLIPPLSNSHWCCWNHSHYSKYICFVDVKRGEIYQRDNQTHN